MRKNTITCNHTNKPTASHAREITQIRKGTRTHTHLHLKQPLPTGSYTGSAAFWRWTNTKIGYTCIEYD